MHFCHTLQIYFLIDLSMMICFVYPDLHFLDYPSACFLSAVFGLPLDSRLVFLDSLLVYLFCWTACLFPEFCMQRNVYLDYTCHFCLLEI